MEPTAAREYMVVFTLKVLTALGARKLTMADCETERDAAGRLVAR
jgi:hypothetical protein